MDYVTKIKINDNTEYTTNIDTDNVTDSVSYIANPKIKDSNGLTSLLSIGAVATNTFMVDIVNPSSTNLDGAKVEVFIIETEELENNVDTTLEDIDISDYTEYGEDTVDTEDYSEDVESLFTDTDNTADIDEDATVYDTEEEFESSLPDDTEIEDATEYTPNPESDYGSDNYEIEDVEEDTEEEIATVEDTETEEDNWHPMGVYYVNAISNNSAENTISLTCYDKITQMVDIYVPNTDNIEDGTIDEYFDDFCEQMEDLYGLSPAIQGWFPVVEATEENKITWKYNFTYREMLGYFASLIGGYAYIDYEGLLQIEPYTISETTIHSTAFVGNGYTQASDGQITIDSVTCYKSAYNIAENPISAGVDNEGDVGIVTFYNPFMTQDIMDNYVFPKFSGLTYWNGSLECEYAGDINTGELVTVYTEEDDAQRNTYVIEYNNSDTTDERKAELETLIAETGSAFLIKNATIDLSTGTMKCDNNGGTTLSAYTQTVSPTDAKFRNLSADMITTEKLVAGEVSAEIIKAVNLSSDKIDGKVINAETIDTTNLNVDNAIINNATIKNLVADNETIKGDLSANSANISTLQTDNVTINKTLSANSANISSLQTNKIDSSTVEANYAHMTEGVIDNATINGKNITNSEVFARALSDDLITTWLGVKVFYQSDTPTATNDGDLWYKTTLDKDTYDPRATVLYKWNAKDNKWVDTETTVTSVLTPNSIIAQDIASNQITANHIQADSIDASKIKSHTITVDEITTDNLTGSGGWINLEQGTFEFGKKDTQGSWATNYITWDGSDLNIQASDVSINTSGLHALDNQVNGARLYSIDGTTTRYTTAEDSSGNTVQVDNFTTSSCSYNDDGEITKTYTELFITPDGTITLSSSGTDSEGNIIQYGYLYDDNSISATVENLTDTVDIGENKTVISGDYSHGLEISDSKLALQQNGEDLLWLDNTSADKQDTVYTNQIQIGNLLLSYENGLVIKKGTEIVTEEVSS